MRARSLWGGFVAAGAAVLLWCASASAYQVTKTGTGKEIKWASGGATYYINATGAPTGASEALQAALQTWNYAGTSFVFTYGGTTTSTAAGTNDGKNIITFGAMGSGSILAQNTFWYNSSTGALSDSDIQFNTSFSWKTDGSASAYDVQAVGTHELGHSLSLMDLYGSADAEKTMYGYAALGETKKRTLEQDDKDGIAYLYPAKVTTGSWSVAGVGDFNSDTQVDLLWRESTGGYVYLWYMANSVRSGGAFTTPSPVSTSWQIAGVGDFNADGKPDVLWRDTAGYLYLWYMNGSAQSGGTYLTPNVVGTSWKVAGLGDFNADGKPDILWQESTAGYLYVWYMNGATQTGGSYLTPSQISTAWKIAGVADFDADGKPDILWRESSAGYLYVWYMNGATQTGGSYLSPNLVATNWKIVGVGDFNADTKPDILWQESTTGTLYLWYMSGATQSSGTYLTPKVP